MLRSLGYLCFGFALVDLNLYYFDIADLTGISWSPLAAAVVGAALVMASRRSSDDRPVSRVGNTGG